MKYYHRLFAAALMATGCTKLPHITFNGKVPGLKDAVFLVTDSAGTGLAGKNITDGSFTADTVLENPGYGILNIKKNGVENSDFEVYLSPGKYTVEADASHLDRYPKITSSSSIQNDLTDYYTLQDEIGIKQFGKPLSQLTVKDGDVNKLKLQAFKKFAENHPNSTAAMHLLADLDYTLDAVAYNKVFGKMSPAVQNSNLGKQIGKRLNTMMKLLPGSTAPGIAGATPDGKSFDPAKLNKKIYVVEFWKSGNQISRLNHQDMVAGLTNHVNMNKVGIVSISLDTKRDWWTQAITGDKMNWAQYADLKGDNSPNAEKWAVTKIPTYYLLDGNWKVIERDIAYSRLEFSINDYLSHH